MLRKSRPKATSVLAVGAAAAILGSIDIHVDKLALS